MRINSYKNTTSTQKINTVLQLTLLYLSNNYLSRVQNPLASYNIKQISNQMCMITGANRCITECMTKTRKPSLKAAPINHFRNILADCGIYLFSVSNSGLLFSHDIVQVQLNVHFN